MAAKTSCQEENSLCYNLLGFISIHPGKGTEMAKLIPAAERIVRARKLIQQAREFPIPAELGKNDLSYIAGVKDLLRQARDMVKFIPQTAGVSAEMKEEVRKIYEEADQANREILY
jgi:hypothetical protein